GRPTRSGGMAACGGETSRSEPSPLSYTPRLEADLRRRRIESSAHDADSVQTTRPQLVFRHRRDFAGEPQEGLGTHRQGASIRARLVSARRRRRQNCLVVAAADAGGEEAVIFSTVAAEVTRRMPLTPSLSPSEGERVPEGRVWGAVHGGDARCERRGNFP